MKMKQFLGASVLWCVIVGTTSSGFAINQWEYIDPTDPSQGVRESSTPCPGGGGEAGPWRNWLWIDLTQAYLANADLRGTSFVECALTTGYFRDSDLTSASFQNCDLTGADFTGATIAGVLFANVAGFTPQHLYGTVDYQAGNLSGVYVRNVNLAGGNFAGQNLFNAKFDYNTLTDADFTNANLADASLQGSTLTGTSFAGATVTGTNFYLTTGFGVPQLYATASYQAHDLTGIWLMQLDMTQGNFAGQNLSNANFMSGTLTNANFAGANFTNASSEYTKLAGASFAAADLTNARFSGSDLTGANFAGATVTGARLDHTTGFTLDQLHSTASYQTGNLSGIWLGGNDLTSGKFAGCNLSNADLIGGTLTNADFSNANLSNATLEGAVLTGASLAGATVTGTRFTTNGGLGITLPQLRSTASYQAGNLSGIQIRNSDLAGWDFAGQNLTGADLSGTNLAGADLSNANLTNASLAWCWMAGTNFTDATINGADVWISTDFTLPQLYSTASYKNKDLSNIQFWGSNLGGGNFKGQDFSGAILVGTDLTDADLRYANIESAAKQNTILTGADLRHAACGYLDRVTLHNTILADGTINYLLLAAGESLLVRNDPMAIHATGEPSFDPASAIEMVLDDAPWGSTISFDPGVNVSLAGELSLTFAADVTASDLVGDTFQLFDWTGVRRTGEFDVVSDPGCVWDLSQLYTTGQVTLVGVPEPSTLMLLGISGLVFFGRFWRRRATSRQVAS
jgi:uncharacterized protein YjbI with pentapeptide repeats